MSAARYRTEILQIFARMHATREKILPANRRYVELYFMVTWGRISAFAKSLRAPSTTVPEHVEDKFKEYVEYEEERMRQNLQGVKYEVDGPETVYGIVGPGRIEKVSLSYLLDPGPAH